MASTLLKVGNAPLNDVREFLKSLHAFLKNVIPGRCWGEPISNNSETVLYVEIMRDLESGYTLFLQTWRDPAGVLFSAVDAFFKTKDATLRCERTDRSNNRQRFLICLPMK